MLEARLESGPIEVLSLPVSNPRQELYTKQICESKDRTTLALRVVLRMIWRKYLNDKLA
jgi:hypothetical protein